MCVSLCALVPYASHRHYHHHPFLSTGLSFFFALINKNSNLQQHLSDLFVQPVPLPCEALWLLFFFFFFLLLSSPTLRFSNRPVLLFDVGSRKGVGVYSGVVSLTTDAATTLPLMLCPSAARCWSSIREATVPNLRMNRGPIDGARLWGAAVSPLLHAQAGVDGGPGRLPAGEKRG